MTEPARQEQFAALYARAHLHLLRYVLSLLPDRPQAEDIVQDTARSLWQKFDQYDDAKPFLPWARKFAHFEVLKARRRLAVQHKYFTDELIETLAKERVQEEDHLAACREVMVACMKKLDDKSQTLLKERYGGEVSLEDLAKREGKKINAVYVMMHRIRQRLVECVNRTLKMEGWA